MAWEDHNHELKVLFVEALCEKSDVCHNLRSLLDSWEACVSKLVNEILDLDVGKLVVDADDLALHSHGTGLELLVKHPGQVRTANHFLSSFVEEAVVALDELLVTLPEIDHAFSDLWHVEVLLLELVWVDQLVSRDLAPDIVDVLLGKLYNLLPLVSLKVHVVVEVRAENAHPGLIFWLFFF